MAGDIEDSFIHRIAAGYGLPPKALVVRYLERKTKAANRGAKARRSLGNLYALLVLAEDFLDEKPDGSRFTELLGRMKALPFGAKLQNHPLDNRLNDEFGRQLGVQGQLLPVQHTIVNGQKARRIAPQLLKHDSKDPRAAAAFIVDSVREYISLLSEKHSSYIDEIVALETAEDLEEFFEEAFEPNSDARLFEIVSFVLLFEHYRTQSVWIGRDKAEVQEQQLRLFRTGRTNANDGGIDFVLQPSGRFFQVTETLDFKKYFLDFEKVARFPITFVVKIEAPGREVFSLIRAAAEKSGSFSRNQIDSYMSLFEEIFTLTSLREILKALPADKGTIDRIKENLTLQFKLEYGLLD